MDEDWKALAVRVDTRGFAADSELGLPSRRVHKLTTGPELSRLSA